MLGLGPADLVAEHAADVGAGEGPDDLARSSGAARNGPQAAIHFAYVCMFFMRKRSISSKTLAISGSTAEACADLENRP